MARLTFRLVRRNNGVFYCVNRHSLKKESLETKDPREAGRLLAAKNEAQRVPEISQQIAVAYLSVSDPELPKRTWTDVFDAYVKKTLLAGAREQEAPTHRRCQTAVKDKAFDLIRHKRLVMTTSQDFYLVLDRGNVSTNMYLRRFHNFALDMNWLPKAVLVRRVWPKVKHAKRRAITREEHERILAAEGNQERKLFYDFLWHTGASQGDAAKLQASDIDWTNKVISFQRSKRQSQGGGYAIVRIGEKLQMLLRQLPDAGPLFPYLATVRSGDRATEFHQRCVQIGVKGVSLHCYRVSWAQRAKQAGYPERFAMSQLGHGCRAVHEAYAKDAKVVCPSLEHFEQQAEQFSSGDRTIPFVNVA